MHRRLEGDAANDRLFCYAESTWVCDTSTVIEGETVLPFLGSPRGVPANNDACAARLREVLGMQPLRKIPHARYGRMPARTVDRAPYRTLDSNCVSLPASLANIDGPS